MLGTDHEKFLLVVADGRCDINWSKQPRHESSAGGHCCHGVLGGGVDVKEAGCSSLQLTQQNALEDVFT